MNWIEKQIFEKESFEKERMKLWREVCVAVARSDTCRTDTTPANWANAALKEFDKQFKKEGK